MTSNSVEAPGIDLHQRSPAFDRNHKLDVLLGELNELLAHAERPLIDALRAPQHPVVLIVGCPRSGSTLCLQWLAATGCFAWPSNLVGRFYRAPAIGARIQKLLLDAEYDYRDEIGLAAAVRSEGMSSHLGKTRGPLQPSEFWHFWRRFFTFGEDQLIPPEELDRVDVATLLAEMAAFEAVDDRPLAMKGLILNWNLPFLDRILEKVVFVHLRRDPIHCMASVLRSRERFYGTRERWWSFKPPEYAWLRELDRYQQVAGQVLFTDRAVERGLQEVRPERRLLVRYEDLCLKPTWVWEQLAAKLETQGHRPAPPRALLQPEPPNLSALAAGEEQRLDEAARAIEERMR